MDHFEVKVGKVDKPTRLATVKRLGLMEIGQILVVSENLYQKRRAMEVVTPGFQGANDGEEFAVTDVVVVFGGGERLREVRARMPVTVGVGLEEDGAGCIFRCVGSNGEGCGEVREVENGF